jgi:hypothetical protein
MLRLRTPGRRSGAERRAILAYLEDGPDLVLMAMNVWADPAPAWWLNLQATRPPVVELPGGSVREVTAREAQGQAPAPVGQVAERREEARRVRHAEGRNPPCRPGAPTPDGWSIR